MKAAKTFIAVCISLATIFFGTSMTNGVGVAFKYFDEYWNKEQALAALDKWVKEYPRNGCIIDVFWPGYTTFYLENSETSDTIDLEIVPKGEKKSSVIVLDIPELYHEAYAELISNIKDESTGKVSLEITNTAKKGNTLIVDFFGIADICYRDNNMGGMYVSDQYAEAYGVTIDKETNAIIRYDNLGSFGIVDITGANPEPVESPYHYLIEDNLNIELPENFNTSKHRYGFCVLVYDDLYDLFYSGGGYPLYRGNTYLTSLLQIDVPEIDSLFGDVNEDGKLTLSDVTTMMKYIIGWKSIVINTTISDINMDGKTNTDDITLALKRIAGWNV